MDAIAGWYADPEGSGRKRWWDGAAWTGRVESPEVLDALPPPRLLRAEVIVVMAVGILPATCTAIALLVRYLATSRKATLTGVVIPGHTVLDVSTQLLLVIAGAVAIPVVWYVLHRSQESFATIGLTRRRLGREILVACGLVILIFIGLVM